MFVQQQAPGGGSAAGGHRGPGDPAAGPPAPAAATRSASTRPSPASTPRRPTISRASTPVEFHTASSSPPTAADVLGELRDVFSAMDGNNDEEDNESDALSADGPDEVVARDAATDQGEGRADGADDHAGDQQQQRRSVRGFTIRNIGLRRRQVVGGHVSFPERHWGNDSRPAKRLPDGRRHAGRPGELPGGTSGGFRGGHLYCTSGLGQTHAGRFPISDFRFPIGADTPVARELG